MGKSKRQSDANGYASPSLDAGSQVRRFVVDTGGLTADSLYLVLGGSKTVHDLRGRMQHMTSYPLQQREQQKGDPGSGGVCVFVHRRRRRCRAPRAAALLRCCAAALLLRCWLHLLRCCCAAGCTCCPYAPRAPHATKALISSPSPPNHAHTGAIKDALGEALGRRKLRARITGLRHVVDGRPSFLPHALGGVAVAGAVRGAGEGWQGHRAVGDGEKRAARHPSAGGPLRSDLGRNHAPAGPL